MKAHPTRVITALAAALLLLAVVVPKVAGPLKAQVSGPESIQVGEIYELQAAFHRAKTTQDLNLMMSLWDPNATLNVQGDPNSPYVGFDQIKAFWQSSGSFTHHRFSLFPSYARHGIDLIIDPVHRDLPHSQVLAEFGRQLSDISDFCEGGSLASGNAGAGKYSESFDDLKAAFFHTEQSEDHVVHYAIFGHYTTNDSPAHAGACPATGLIPSPASFGASGLAVIDGGLPAGPFPNHGNFMVTLGNAIQDRNAAPTVLNVGGTFMHELGSLG